MNTRKQNYFKTSRFPFFYSVLHILGLLTILFVSAKTSEAVIIDFDSLNNENAFITPLPTPYVEDGIEVLASGEAYVLSDSHPFTTGSPLAFPGVADVEFTIKALDDSFGIALRSVSIVEVQNGGMLNINFTGTRLDGSTVTEVVSTEGETDILQDNGSPEVYSFASLSSELFDSISFIAVGTGLGFDNLEVQTESFVVPEPRTSWTLIVFVASVGLCHRRHSFKSIVAWYCQCSMTSSFSNDR